MAAFLVFLATSLQAADRVLIVADEIPAMEVLAAKLKAGAGVETSIVWQTNLPVELRPYAAVVVYIHRELFEPAERALVDYTQSGGKLIVLHHSISSGKRKNKLWFDFLAIGLPTGDVDQGGYKWIEPAALTVVNLAPHHFITGDQVKYPEKTSYRSSDSTEPAIERDSFSLPDSEAYLNHTFTRPRTVLLGLKYADPKSGKVYMQDRAGWIMSADRGWVFYFQPGHSAKEFENPVFAQILVNTLRFAPPKS
jgi:hypothetical protein